MLLIPTATNSKAVNRCHWVAGLFDGETEGNNPARGWQRQQQLRGRGGQRRPKHTWLLAPGWRPADRGPPLHPHALDCSTSSRARRSTRPIWSPAGPTPAHTWRAPWPRAWPRAGENAALTGTEPSAWRSKGKQGSQTALHCWREHTGQRNGDPTQKAQGDPQPLFNCTHGSTCAPTLNMGPTEWLPVGKCPSL